MMNKAMIVLCLALGIASLFNEQYLASAASIDPYAAICNVVAQNEGSTSAYLTKLNSDYASGVGTKTFPLTMAYVTNAANQKLLLGSKTSCANFFHGIEIPLAADLTKDGVEVTNAKQAVLQQIVNYFPQMAGQLG